MDGEFPRIESEISLSDLEAQITELAGHLNAANYRWLTLIAEFDRRLGWSDGALHSCAHWLNFKCGLDLGAAREKVRVAHALKDLPKIAACMARGELSYSKVRALTRVACAGTEDYFLSIALHGTAHHVEKLVRLYRRCQQAEELSREERQQANRSLSYWFDEDGSVVLKGRLPAVSGALFIKALESAMEAFPKPSVAAETWDDDLSEQQAITHEARRADALALLAESYLQQGTAALNTADRYQVVVHVDLQSKRVLSAGFNAARWRVRWAWWARRVSRWRADCR